MSELIDYRLEIRDAVREVGYVPVDQYSDALDRVAGADDPRTAFRSLLDHRDGLTTEPYLEAIESAVAARSVGAVVESPGIVPEIASEETIDRIVERDLELLRSCDGMLAYFPQPSNGTTVELLHAVEHDIPAHVVSESPSMFVQKYADAVHETTTTALEHLSADLES